MDVDHDGGLHAYIEGLGFSGAGRSGQPQAWRAVRSGAQAVADPLKSVVDVGALVAFAGNVPEAQRQDVLDAVQLAQRAATGLFDRHANTEKWYGKFTEVLERIGWTTSQFAFVKHDQGTGELKLDRTALTILAAVATQNALGVLTASIDALKALADNDHAITIFKRFASKDASGNFQLGAVELSAQGALSMALGAFYYKATDQRTKMVFGSWGASDIQFWSAAQNMTLNTKQYDLAREKLREKLGDPGNYVAELDLG